MKRTNLLTFFGVLLLTLPLATASAQRVAEPGTFDPQTTAAHEPIDPALVLEPLSSKLPSMDAPISRTPGRVIVPSSSVVRSEDTGLRAHTNHLVFVPQGMQLAAGAAQANPQDVRSAAGIAPAVTFSENPGSLACVYQIIPTYAGCTYAGGFGKHAVGGSGAIAIVDAFHNPDAASDLAYFSSYWGLPAATFLQYYCTGSTGTCATTNPAPPVNTGWGLEIALDIEWAHAMAPGAKIILVEAHSNSTADLNWAEAWAAYLVDINGGGQVSNSWGESEFTGETASDPYFNNYFGNYHPVVYLASGGDSGSVEYPSASPFVVSVGGTTINRDSSGNLLSQTCWSGTGRGASTVEPIPSFQSAVALLAGSKRLTTDISADADPSSGVWVYDALNGGWFVVGGTSVASPVVAGIMNNAANFFGSSFQENSLLYSEYVGRATHAADFYDPAPVGYDNCTGVGTPRTLIGK